MGLSTLLGSMIVWYNSGMDQRENASRHETHCCACYQKEIDFQSTPANETQVVIRAIDACENTGEGSLAAQSYLAAFFKREEAKITKLTMPRWDNKI
jgi:hypothetical protein